MNKTFKLEIHQKALDIVAHYKRAEADLIEILQKVDEHRVYLQFECKNLHEYTMKALKLTESVAFNFIVVARKAKEIPQLKKAIEAGTLSVSKARKITAVLTPSNQEHWLQLAVDLPQKKLEQEVARVFPKEATPEKMKFVSGERLNLQMGISENLSLKLKRAQDLASQKRKRHVTLEETLEVLLEVYLEKHDPVVRAQRILGKKLNLNEKADSDKKSGLNKTSSEKFELNKTSHLPVARQVNARANRRVQYESNDLQCEINNPQCEINNPQCEINNPQCETNNPQCETNNPQCETNDPQRKINRLQRESSHPATSAATIRHQVHWRDKGQCTHIDIHGKRCAEHRWIDIHHIVPKNLGGLDKVENLTTLCSGHHRLVHSHSTSSD